MRTIGADPRHHDLCQSDIDTRALARHIEHLIPPQYYLCAVIIRTLLHTILPSVSPTLRYGGIAPVIARHHSRRVWQGRIAPGLILAMIVAAMIFAAEPHRAALAAQRGQRRGATRQPRTGYRL